MLKIKVSGKTGDEITADEPSFELNQKGKQWLIGDKPFDGDIVQIRENQYHILWKNRSFNVEVAAQSVADKTFRLLINGHPYDTSVKDQFDQLLEALGIQPNAVKKINTLKAPMPGLIQSVAVVQGQEVQKGDTLLVLVAMKMENMIKSTGNGFVKSLKILPGEIVEKNQVLIEFQ